MFAWSRASTSTPAIVIIPSINSNLFIGWMRILFRSANTWYTFASPKMPFIHSNLVARAFGTSHLKSKNQSFSLFSKWKLMRLAIYKFFFHESWIYESWFFPTKICYLFSSPQSQELISQGQKRFRIAENRSRKAKNDLARPKIDLERPKSISQGQKSISQGLATKGGECNDKHRYVPASIKNISSNRIDYYENAMRFCNLFVSNVQA